MTPVASDERAHATGGLGKKGHFSVRRLGKEVVIYGLGTAASRLAAFIMLPIYTRLLTPADFGLLQLLDMMLDVAAIMMSAGITAGVMNFYFKADSARRRDEILGSAVLLETGLNLVGTVLMVVAAVPIWHVGLKGTGPATLVYIAAANFTLSVLGNVPALKMQIERRAALYSIMTFCRVVLQLGLNILFLVVFHWGVRGILLSTFATNLIMGISTLAWMFWRTPLRVSRGAMLDLRRFGVPYQITTVATFVLTFGDRFFIEAFQGLAIVGIYSLAYQFGFFLTRFAVMPFSQAWTPQRYELATHDRAFRDAKYNQGFRVLNLLVITGAVGICAFVRPVLQIMSDAAFWPAAAVVPAVLVAYVLQAWGGVVAFGIDFSERTKYVTYATWISVFVVVACYALLIPPFGAMGAAAATAIAFFVRFGLLYWYSQRLWPVSYEWAHALRLVGIGTIVTLAAFLIDLRGVMPKLALGTALMTGYTVLAWFLALEREERRQLSAGLLRSPRTAFVRFLRA